MKLYKNGYSVLGTSPLSIDMAEDRHKFSELLDKLKIDQPEWRELTSIEDILDFADEVGYPLLVRPSYVLSGSSMNIVSNESELEKFLKLAASVSKQYPVVVSKFIEEAKEIEMDAVADNGEILAYAISEHVEFAGVHSGDATMLFPPQKVYVETTRRIKKITSQIAQSLNITGPFNLQFLAKDNDVKVIECNVRASRSFPFVSKVLKSNLIELATKAILGQKPLKPNKSLFDLDYIGVKAPQFSFARLHSADPVLGVEMASTGEVGCLGENYYEAILSAMLSVGYIIPKKNILFSGGPVRSKTELVNSAKMLIDNGYNVFSTGGTYDFLKNAGLETNRVYRPNEAGTPQVLDMIKQKQFDLIINIPKDLTEKELEKDYLIRRIAVDGNTPLITNARLASAFIYAFCKIGINDISIKSWQEM
jgi:carbamoyl-phosphate synthase large subunit